MTEHDEAVLKYLDAATEAMNGAVGAFTLHWQDMKKLHAKLLKISQDLDETAEMIRDALEE